MERQGLYAGYKLNRWAPAVSHIMFADDVMLFGVLNNTTISAITSSSIMLCQDSWSIIASLLSISKTVSLDRQEEVKATLGVRGMGLKEKYLGIMIRRQGNVCFHHHFLVEKFESKLSGWKRDCLNPAGRTTLIQGVLSLIPVYYMATTAIPKGITSKLTEIIRNFWWGHSNEKRKMHYFRWDWFITSKEKGGLGLRDLDELNKALLGKLSWRFLQQGDALWCKILKEKYLREGSFWAVKKPQRCSSTWSAMLDVRDSLKEGCIWLVGGGNNIRVWTDPWIPSLPDCTLQTELRVHQSIQWVSDLMNPGNIGWNEGLIRQLFEPFVANQILQVFINHGEQDKLIWKYTTHGDYTAQSFQQVQVANSGESSSMNDTTVPWKKFWSVRKLAPRIHTFIWRVLHNGIGVRQRLARFLESVPPDCVSCGVAEESVDHLFLHCPTSQAILFACPLGLRLENPCNTTVKDLILGWLSMNDDNYAFNLGACMLWAIWRARNELIFEKKEIEVQAVISHGLYWFNTFYLFEPDDNQALFPTAPVSITPICEQWFHPPMGTVSITVDAAWSASYAVVAVVARDYRGKFIAAKTNVGDGFSPLTAEGSGFLLAVCFSLEMKFTKVIIEGDTQKVVTAIRGTATKVQWRILRYISQIKQKINSFAEIDFKFIPRDANEVAHLLAKYAFRHNIYQEWISSQPPSCIASQLQLEEVHESAS